MPGFGPVGKRSFAAPPASGPIKVQRGSVGDGMSGLRRRRPVEVGSTHPVGILTSVRELQDHHGPLMCSFRNAVGGREIAAPLLRSTSARDAPHNRRADLSRGENR